MEQTKKSTFKLLFYLKKNELKKNGNAPIMARITIDGTPKTLGTKLEIDPNNWDLKYGRVEGKSATALSINKKLDNIRGRIDKIYEDMLKHEGFATAQKVKLSFLGVGVMDDAILKVFNDQNEDFKKLVEKEDLIPIAKGQLKLEKEISQKVEKLLICDTNLLELKVYSEYYYEGFCPSEIKREATKNDYSIYLLTYIDTPWEADDLRDRPENREEMFRIFEAELKKQNFPYKILMGNEKERFNRAVEIIDELLK